MNFFIKNILFSLFLSFALSAVISYGGDCAEIESIVRERVSDVDSCIKECIVNNAGEVTTLKLSDQKLSEAQIKRILSYKSITVLHYMYYCYVNIQCNIRQEFPKEILDLPNLKEFRYDYNKHYQKRKIHRHYTTVLDSNIINKLKNLKRLELSYIEFNEDIVNEILSLSKLKTLKLENCPMNGLNYEFVKKIKKLNSLGVTNEEPVDVVQYLKDKGDLEYLYLNVKSLSQTDIDGVSKLRNLKELSLINEENVNSTLNFKPISNLTKLKELTLDFNESETCVQDVSFNNLKKLNNLTLNTVKLTQTNVNEISKLSKIKKLYLSSCDLKDVNVTPLKKLEKVEELYIYECKDQSCNYDQILSTISSLKNMKKLTVNFITGILPKEFGNLKKLEYLDLSLNDIKTIPNVFSKFNKLQYLDLSSNEITEIPSSFKYLKNLKKLDMRFNSLTKLPDFIGELKSLEYIDFYYNKIENLPSSLGNLVNLEHLDLSVNKIDDEIPESMNSLTKLKYVSFRENAKLRGKTLTNSSLEKCSYHNSYLGTPPDVCIAKNMDCIESDNVNLKPCVTNSTEN